LVTRLCAFGGLEAKAAPGFVCFEYLFRVFTGGVEV
jgi:hypothetical protein